MNKTKTFWTDGGKSADVYPVEKENHIWLVQRKVLGMGYLPYQVHLNRADARDVAKYFNGFSHGTKASKYRVKKYMEVGK